MSSYVIDKQPTTNPFLKLPILKSTRNQLAAIYSNDYIITNSFFFFAFPCLHPVLLLKIEGKEDEKIRRQLLRKYWFDMASYDSVAFFEIMGPNALILICCIFLCILYGSVCIR